MKNLPFRYIVFIIAIAGFLLSLLTHVFVLIGWNAQDFSVSPFVLHILAMFAFGAAFITTVTEYMQIPLDFRPQSLIRMVFSRAPKWLIAATLISLIYAFVNFFAALPPGAPVEHEGKFTLENHGKVIREITADEFKAAQRGEIRGFSGHWVLFFLAAMLLAYPHRDPAEKTEG